MEHIKSPKFILGFLGILAVTAVVIVALARNPYGNPPPQFNAIGEGKVLVAPDVAMVRVGFATPPKANASEAVKENTFVMNRILTLVAEQGVAQDQIKTVNYTLTPQYEYPDGRQRLLGYVASQELQLKIKDLAKVGDVIGAATVGGANQVSDIQFTLENPEAAKAEAREKAIAAAKVKAEASSQAAGLTLKKLINMYDSEPYPTPLYDGKGGVGGGGAGSVPVSQGSYEVVVQVTLVYEVK
ncbi:hypothetical protein A3J43_00535 [Candidatus Uhrbacteria bacterium RIFCSPHIGHO2_12_FULL_54_23]|uniref:SIMPL domain-containing protein n=3 Tax=Candidatus Uhriibacteriota TaxID=1752732 RepID=A0A1F7UG94_9BACT|nr:MAG: hypothetical protein A3J43_00535 [Candidatus Uhrbacteria bacterium RIFCSPHIGHO2_12_FULL_54_23]OGL85255.1 MAG: hypothetical protein A3B36_00125 [Candidatus Uhrbacteria bacterium RIFCSPLOWO2_01_FULL_55_36]OGL89681.1 MAG: hypothetical protein A3J36_01270 [Candidatus Uhrbacteria bacterium RIFCSPLOWO2_02_FULL_54_37]